MRAATTKRLRFLPYRFDDHGLTLRLERCILDGQRDVSASYDEERHLLDLSSGRWRDAHVVVAMTVSEALLSDVFPDEERAAPSGRLAALVICKATRVRRALVLVEGIVGAGVHRADLELSVRDLRGAVEVTPVLVRTIDRPESDDGFAVTAGSRLATGLSAEIRIDASRPPNGEFLDIRYESFRTQGAPQFPRPDALYQLDCDGDEPVLWLNLDHAAVCSALDSAGSVGRVARLRDVVFAQVAMSVWTRLFWRAARSVQLVGETVHEWEDAVLMRLLPRVYPDSPNHESRLAALRADLDSDQEEGVLARLDGALQDMLELGGTLTHLAEELA